jgi:hypothetical protein
VCGPASVILVCGIATHPVSVLVPVGWLTRTQRVGGQLLSIGPGRGGSPPRHDPCRAPPALQDLHPLSTAGLLALRITGGRSRPGQHRRLHSQSVMSRVPVRQRGKYGGEKALGDKMKAQKRKLFYKPLKRRGIIFIRPSGLSPSSASSLFKSTSRSVSPAFGPKVLTVPSELLAEFSPRRARMTKRRKREGPKTHRSEQGEGEVCDEIAGVSFAPPFRSFKPLWRIPGSCR